MLRGLEALVSGLVFDDEAAHEFVVAGGCEVKVGDYVVVEVNDL